MNEQRKGRNVVGRSFSLFYNDLARWLFITLALTGMLSTGWFGIPLVPRYLLLHQIDIEAGVFTLLSSLGSIWGIMAYQEFTRSANLVNGARSLAQKFDPMIGEYEYHSYNPETKEYDQGYVPLGPIDFWDKETHAPDWLDKGKYWHILLGLQAANREVVVQVVRDIELPFSSGRRNVAVTYKESKKRSGFSFFARGSRTRHSFRVKVPQWSVMNTERVRFVEYKERLNIDNGQLNSLIAELNQNLVRVAFEIIERESPRIRYPWATTALGIYLNKSLPLRLVYKQIVKRFPGLRKRIIRNANENLANLQDEELAIALLELATMKGISRARSGNLRTLLGFLKNAYTRQGIGEGSSEYHNFHHSLEVGYLSLMMMPKQFRKHTFGSRDYELILVAALLHDYDPAQAYSYGEKEENKNPKGPKVTRTIEEISNTRIHDAYFTMNGPHFEEYFRQYNEALSPAMELTTTHPEYLDSHKERPIESTIVEALIWRTDFPYSKQIHSQQMYSELLSDLKNKNQDLEKIQLMSEILWLSDLSVTYMSSDPIRAWDRVSSLYDELYLPRVEAVSRTDAFFSDFAENEFFKELIRDRQFPDIFRRRWIMIYNFFHEGNPSTQLVRAVNVARKSYIKVNVEVRMRNSDVLRDIAIANWAEYFIAIGKDQLEVLKAKSKFSDLDPPNARPFWGDSQKLLPYIPDKSIDNFLLTLSQTLDPIGSDEEKLSLKNMFVLLSSKLTKSGTLQVLIGTEGSANYCSKLKQLAFQSGFVIDSNNSKVYFKPDRYHPEAIQEKLLVFVFKRKAEDRTDNAVQ